MKQITLGYDPVATRRRAVCSGRLLFTWGLYGVAMAWLWRLAEGNPVAQAATWMLAGGIALALLLGMLEG